MQHLGNPLRLHISTRLYGSVLRLVRCRILLCLSGLPRHPHMRCQILVRRLCGEMNASLSGGARVSQIVHPVRGNFHHREHVQRLLYIYDPVSQVDADL